MKTLFAIAAAICACVALPATAAAYTSTGTTYPLIVVNNGPGTQADPRVNGDYVAYTDATSATSATIGYFNFASNATASVPSDPNPYDGLADINNGNIVFTRGTADGFLHIFEYVIGSTSPVEVAPSATAVRKNPSIGGSTIAWEDIGASSSANPELVVNTPAGSTQLTNDTPADRNPNVSPAGDMLVWEKCGSSCDVYAATGSGTAWTVTPVATSTAYETWPDTNGTQIVYASEASGASHIYVTTPGGLPAVIPTSTASERHPAISGSFVAFEGSTGLASETDIYVYDLSTNTLRQITNTPESEQLADVTVSGSTVRVVWQVSEAGDENVYASQFQVSTQQPFTDQFLAPLTQSTDPANPVINTGKNGKVIPVKVQISQGGTAITDANAPGPVTIAVSKLASCSSSAGTDPIATYADAGQSSAGTNQFNYDPLAQAWVYNLDTKALGLVTGNCYRIDVFVNGTQVTNAFAVFQPTK